MCNIKYTAVYMAHVYSHACRRNTYKTTCIQTTSNDISECIYVHMSVYIQVKLDTVINDYKYFILALFLF